MNGPRLIVAVGPGDADGVPARAVARLARELDGDPALTVDLDAATAAVLGVATRAREAGHPPPDGAVMVASNAVAHRLALVHPQTPTWPERALLRDWAIGAEVAALARVGAHLRRACPWDREQTAATIVPHTIEEAFEVAEAVSSGEGLPDELGDLLFQAVFLSQLLEEEGAADLASVARGQVDKLIARHPHVYGEAAAADAAAVVALWERRKRAERADQGIFHDLPAGLPALAYATKAQKRAAAAGLEMAEDEAIARVRAGVSRLERDSGGAEVAIGQLLFSCVALAGRLRVDPELALRAAAGDFRVALERAAARAAAEGYTYEELSPEGRWARHRRAGEEG